MQVAYTRAEGLSEARCLAERGRCRPFTANHLLRMCAIRDLSGERLLNPSPGPLR